MTRIAEQHIQTAEVLTNEASTLRAPSWVHKIEPTDDQINSSHSGST
jgi:hypothetical protein